MTLIFFLIDCRMRPLITSVAANRARVVSSAIINEVVLDEISKLDIMKKGAALFFNSTIIKYY